MRTAFAVPSCKQEEEGEEEDDDEEATCKCKWLIWFLFDTL